MKKKQIKQFNSLSEERKQNVLKSLEMEVMKEATENRMRTNKAIQNYFKKYNAASVENFIKDYVTFKETWITKGLEAKKQNEEMALYFHSDGLQALKKVLQKKLLMKICQWSADLVELEGVEISSDFHYWNEDILNCPFIDLITEQEINIYKQYFTSPEYDELKWDHPLYTYYFVKHSIAINGGNTAERGDEPEFSILYDTYMGTTSFWILPNKKCTREAHYSKIFNDHRIDTYNKGVADGTIAARKTDEREYLSSYSKKNIETFMQRFESPELLADFRAYNYSNKDRREDMTGEEEQLRDYAAESYFRMEDLEISLPVEAADDHRKALKQAWAKYKQQQILKTIDILFEDYLFRKQNGIQFERDEKEINNAIEYANHLKMEIIEGRRLVGEPADLNIFENL